MRVLDLAGKKFGRLQVRGRVETKDGHARWECVCDCGKHIVKVGSDLKRHNLGCSGGCSRRLRLVGQKYGDLLVLKYARSDKNGQSMWEVKCNCGKIATIRGQDLKMGNAASCGCKRGFIHGFSRTKAYQMWLGAKGHAKSQGLPFTITLERVQELVESTSVCPLLGIPIDKHATRHADNMPSLDKIIPRDGYTPSNSWIVSWRANKLKLDATLGELKMLTTNLEKRMRAS